MRFGSQVDYPVKLRCLKEFVNGFFISDVCLDKFVVCRIFYVRKILKVACISECIKVVNQVVFVFVDKQPYYVAPNKSRSPCD